MARRRAFVLAILVVGLTLALAGQAVATWPPLPTPPCLPAVGC
jgi:hypothetical protein